MGDAWSLTMLSWPGKELLSFGVRGVKRLMLPAVLLTQRQQNSRALLLISGWSTASNFDSFMAKGQIDPEMCSGWVS